MTRTGTLATLLLFSACSSMLHAQQGPQDPPTLIALRKLATQVEAKVQIPGYAALARPTVLLNAGAGISFYTGGDRTVHAAQFDDLPSSTQDLFKQLGSLTPDEPDGKAFFDDMFHHFFFVHELGHWMVGEVMAGLPQQERAIVAKNESANKWESETAANRIAVAWYREHDPKYLTRLIADFRRIEAKLPDPVPAGIDKKSYFTDNYEKLSTDPVGYGWYQLQMVLVVYDEPKQTFQQVLNELPKNRFEREK